MSQFYFYTKGNVEYVARRTHLQKDFTFLGKVEERNLPHIHMNVSHVQLVELKLKERIIKQTYIQTGRGFMYRFPSEKVVISK